jgi:outer membrane protein assembly factor BamB
MCHRGTLYVPGGDGVLHSYDTASGQRLWSARPDPAAAGVLEAPRLFDDTVFVVRGSSDRPRSWTLCALHAETGRPRWREPLRLLPPQHWLVTGDRVVTVTAEPDAGAFSLTAYDVNSGVPLWRKALSGAVAGGPTRSGRWLHLAHPDGLVSSWDAVNGDHRWTVRVARALRTRPVVTGELLLISAWEPGRLIALHQTDGSVAWHGTVRPSAALMTPAFVAGRTAWAVSRAGVLLGWDVGTGRRLPGTYEGLLWDPATQGMPAAHDGVLHVVTGNGGLHAIELDANRSKLS